MNTRSYRAYTRTPKHPIEHTPIYDLAAYYQRKKQAQNRKRLLDTSAFFSIVILAIFLFQIGGVA